MIAVIVTYTRIYVVPLRSNISFILVASLKQIQRSIDLFPDYVNIFSGFDKFLNYC